VKENLEKLKEIRERRRSRKRGRSQRIKWGGKQMIRRGKRWGRRGFGGRGVGGEKAKENVGDRLGDNLGENVDENVRGGRRRRKAGDKLSKWGRRRWRR
jgi:hypothetical protein